MNPPPYQHSKKRKFQASQPRPARDYIIYADRSSSPALSDITVSPAPSLDEDDTPSFLGFGEAAHTTSTNMGDELHNALLNLNQTNQNGEEGKPRKRGKKGKPRAARALQIDTLEDKGVVPKVLRIERQHCKPSKSFTFESSHVEKNFKVVRTVSPVKSRKIEDRRGDDEQVIFRRRLNSTIPNTFYNEVSQSSSRE